MLIRILVVIASIQVILLSLSFPIGELFSDKPLFYIDNVMHWYRLKIATALASDSVIIGYDPFMGAGVPAGITGNPAAKLPALFAILLNSFLSEMQIWKLYVFMSALIAPLCIPVAMRLLKFNVFIIVIASLLGLLIWWASWFRWFHTAGLVSYVLVSYLSVFYFAILVVYFEKEKNSFIFALVLGAFGALFFFIHPLFFVPAVFSTLCLLIFYWKVITARKLFYLFALVPIVSLLPNMVWIIPQFFEKIYIAFKSGLTHQAVADVNIIWKEAIGVWETPARGAKIYPVLVLASLTSLLFLKELKQKKLIISIIFLSLSLILFAALGALNETVGGMTQPNRFSVMGYLFLSLVSSVGIYLMFKNFIRAKSARTRITYAGLSFFVISGILFSMNEVRHEIVASDHGRYGVISPEVKGIGEYTTYLLEKIPRLAGKNERVLFETANGRIHDGIHIAGYLALSTEREFIGGPYPFSHFAGYWDGFLFGQDIRQFSDEEMLKYLDLYNVGVIIAHSEVSKKYWDNSRSARLVDEFKEIKIYARDNNKKSFFYKGEGMRVESKHNSIKFSSVTGDEIILKYHYIEGIKSKPEVTLEPIYLENDPNPFILIKMPPDSFELFM